MRTSTFPSSHQDGPLRLQLPRRTSSWTRQARMPFSHSASIPHSTLNLLLLFSTVYTYIPKPEGGKTLRKKRLTRVQEIWVEKKFRKNEVWARNPIHREENWPTQGDTKRQGQTWDQVPWHLSPSSWNLPTKKTTSRLERVKINFIWFEINSMFTPLPSYLKISGGVSVKEPQ